MRAFRVAPDGDCTATSVELRTPGSTATSSAEARLQIADDSFGPALCGFPVALSMDVCRVARAGFPHCLFL